MIWAARMPAFFEPSTATVATGMPDGHLHRGEQCVEPVGDAAAERHADDGQRRVGGEHTGEVGSDAGAADEHGVARVACPGGKRRHLGRVAVRRHHVLVDLDAEAFEHRLRARHLVVVVGRPHQHCDLHHLLAFRSARRPSPRCRSGDSRPGDRSSSTPAYARARASCSVAPRPVTASSRPPPLVTSPPLRA